MSHIHVVIPDSITGEKRWALENALASSSLEGQDNPKIQQMVVDSVASGQSADDFIKEFIHQIKNNPDFFKQFN
ncbi:MAG: hypothetical protein LBQ34_02085 [Alphaproteobacteria bacterium]|jgi:hypothetical protein|nr:hypothetical protein [Alphaproteobacteria bacterium]